MATTAPAHATLFTGLLPLWHGLLKNGQALAPGHRVLAAALGEAGYRTGAVVSSFALDHRFGLNAGFASYDDRFSGRDPSMKTPLWEGNPLDAPFDRRADETRERAVQWLRDNGYLERRRPRGQPPFFLWVHFFDPHSPYDPPAAHRAPFPPRGEAPLDASVAAYDGEIHFADAQVGELLDALGQAGALDRTLTLVTADHGEGLMQHGHMEHGLHIYEESVRVPLVVHWPQRLGARVVEGPVQLADVAPTVAALAGLPWPAREGQGRSLAAVLRGEERPDPAREVLPAAPPVRRAAALGPRGQGPAVRAAGGPLEIHRERGGADVRALRPRSRPRRAPQPAAVRAAGGGGAAAPPGALGDLGPRASHGARGRRGGGPPAALARLRAVRALLAARGGSRAAFGGRCIPAGCVAPPSNMPDILGRRALPAGRLARLGATPDFHHGLLAGLLAAATLAAGCSQTAPPARRPPSLLLVTVDTLRADHLGFAGYPRATSPSLDALASAGTAFSRCYSVSATTGAAHASLFTSRYPHEHGVVANRQRFPKSFPSLMTSLRARGYRTAGFVSSVVLGRKTGLQDEFEHFDDRAAAPERNRPDRAERPAAATLQAAGDFVAALPDGAAFFVWTHLIDPHGPYDAPEQPDRFVGDAHVDAVPRLLPVGKEDWVREQIPAYQVLGDRREADYYVARYDAEIRYADDALGKLFARLREIGRDDDTLIVVTADHGETLAEAGHKRYFAHGTIAYEEVVRIPLVFREPRGGRRLRALDASRPLTSLDMAPTVLDLLGQPPEPSFGGRSLLRGGRADGEPFFSLGAYGSELLEETIGTQFSVRQGPWRYLVNVPDGAEELYDHRDDPRESRDVAARHPAERDALRAELARLRSARPRPATVVETTPEHERALRALGYVQ